MRITTTYFGPAELKNLYIATSRDRQRHSAGQTVGLVANRPNCNLLMHINSQSHFNISNVSSVAGGWNLCDRCSLYFGIIILYDFSLL